MNPRWFCETQVAEGNTVAITGEQGHHYARVLRVTMGELIPLAAAGQGYLGKVTAVDAKQGRVELFIQEVLPPHEPSTQVYLIQGLAKGDKIDTILQHNTELGTSGFLLFAAKRSVVRLDDRKAEDKCQRWRKVVSEAASQSQRDVVPDVQYAATFQRATEWCRNINPHVILFLDEDEGDNGLKQVLSRTQFEDSGARIVVVVGPEGGWDDTEREVWRTLADTVATSLGRRILRTETAGLSAVAATLHHFGDLGG